MKRSLALLALALWTSSASLFGATAACSITTAAGTGYSGSYGDSGPALSARLAAPTGSAVAANGDVYVADTDNNKIRKIKASNGNIYTVAGTGTAGFSGDGGPATNARLNAPRAVVFDSLGNLYFADLFNNRIRKINATSGIISTVAGGFSAGFSGDGGPAVSAQLYNPRGLAIDGSRNLYIADTQNSRIRKVDASSGIISTVAGNGSAAYYGDGGPASSAALNYPRGVIVNGQGDLYIGDTYNNRIRKVTASNGIVSTVAGSGLYGSSGDGGPALNASFANPMGLALDSSGNLYIADYYNGRVRELLSDTGVMTTFVGVSIACATAGSGDEGYGISAGLLNPVGLTIDQAGDLFIADSGDNRVRKVFACSAMPTPTPVPPPSGLPNFNGTGSYLMESGNLMRQNHATGATSIRAPLNANWSSSGACTALGTPATSPLVLPNQVLQSYSSGLKSFDRLSGQVMWSFNDPLWNAPAYDADRHVIYLGDTLGNLSALDPSNGRSLWRHMGGSQYNQRSAPLYAQGKIYAGNGTGGFQSIDPDSHAVLWTLPIGSDASASPAYDQGQIFLPTRAGKIYCVNATTGGILWQVSTGSSGDAGVLLTALYVFRQGNDGLVQCRRRSDGARVWQYQCSSFTWGANLCATGAALIVSNDDRCVRALDLDTGREHWRRCFNGNFARSAPFAVCDEIFIAGCAGQYYGLDGTTGNTLWSFTYSKQNAFVDWAEGDGHLYVADAQGFFYDFVSSVPGDPAACVSDLFFTPTRTLTFTASPTRSPSATASPSPSQTPTRSATPSFTATPSITASSTRTASPSCSATPSFSPEDPTVPRPTATISSTPGGQPSLPATEVPLPEDCQPTIEKLRIVPNPSQAAADRMVSLHLGDCGADKVTICVYSQSMVQIICWTDSGVHVQRGQWVHEHFPHASELSNGTYYVRAWVYREDRVATLSGVFEVLR